MKRKGIIAVAVWLLAACMVVGVGCAPQEATKDVGSSDATDSQASVTVDWSPDSDCTLCHTSEQESMENADCGVSTHAEAACVACHTDAESLGTVHEGATTDDKMPKRLRKTEVSEDACLTCHYGTREGLAEATASLTVVDKNGTEAHPHDLPATEAGEHESIACGECHAMHTPGSSADTLLEAATERCQKCHHQNVFECGTCHE